MGAGLSGGRAGAWNRDGVAHRAGGFVCGGRRLTRPLYVRPIMRPDPRDFRALRNEAIPADQLTVDLLHSAVKRLYEGEGATPAVAPSIRVLNLSIGDP